MFIGLRLNAAACIFLSEYLLADFDCTTKYYRWRSKAFALEMCTCQLALTDLILNFCPCRSAVSKSHRQSEREGGGGGGASEHQRVGKRGSSGGDGSRGESDKEGGGGGGGGDQQPPPLAPSSSSWGRKSGPKSTSAATTTSNERVGSSSPLPPTTGGGGHVTSRLVGCRIYNIYMHSLRYLEIVGHLNKAFGNAFLEMHLP